jgi:hypothetical protein
LALKGIEEAVENGKLLKLWEDDSVVSVAKDIVVGVLLTRSPLHFLLLSSPLC